METLTLQEQIQIILEQHETELAYRADGIAPEDYPKVAEKITVLFQTLQK